MRRLLPWIPVLLIAAAISWLSQQPVYPFGLQLPPPFDKLAHASVFAALAFALESALAHERPDLPLYKRHLLVFIAVSAFGALDEFHLSFVPGRDADVFDWMADTGGGILGLALISLSRLRSRSRWVAHSWERGVARRPDPARDLILVADPHWREELVGLDAATISHPDADWLFLGDCFDVWVGLPGMETEAQGRFLAWVKARRAAGAWVGLWLGNREYFLDRHAADFDLMGEGVGGCLKDEGLAFEHGDLINTSDWRYRLWNLISRSGVLWAFFRLLPARTAAKIASTLEAKLRTTNREYKLAFPERAFAQAAEASGGAVFITGHFHTDQRVGKGRALAWAYEGRFQVWRKGQIEDLG
ncbi:MAG: VanZ family protein [Acidobacteria bacterium]|nr:VanZ family protein [Acidobacteriota bacterium]